MKKFDAIISSTRLDAHGDIMSKEALEFAAATLKKNYVPMGVEHDPRIPPIGRFVDACVEQLADGTWILKGLGEIFESGDSLPVSIDRTIVERDYTDGKAHISFDRSYENDDCLPAITEIGQHFGTTPQLEVKKAVDPLSVLAIGAGTFVLGAIASGFFGQIGADGYNLLKTKLSNLIFKQKSKSKEQILVFEFTAIHNSIKVLVQTLLINPTDSDIEEFLKHQIYDLDRLPLVAFDSAAHISRIVYFYENKQLEFKYAVRKDGFPVTFKKITET